MEQALCEIASAEIFPVLETTSTKSFCSSLLTFGIRFENSTSEVSRFVP